MARRGFFAELQHQSRVSAQKAASAHKQAVKDHQNAVRQAEQLRKAAQRLQENMARSSAAEQKRMEREAKEAHVAAMEAEVEEKNKKLEDDYSEIDGILEATLGVDDFVDISSLRAQVLHPPFDPKGLDMQVPVPAPIPVPIQPEFVSPDQPKGFAAIFGKTKFAEAVAKAQGQHNQALLEWHLKREQVLAQQKDADAAHARAETDRVALLERAKSEYAEACAAREAEAVEQNRRLEEFIANLGYGTAEAVQEYVSIVLSNSVYPECFPISHDFSFEPAVAELKLKVLVPGPDKVPEVKAYKYAKSSDEITSTNLSQKACRDRYEGAVHQVALRSIHEVFEADRRGLIKTISLTVGTETIDPATGRLAYIPFVVVGAEREKYLAFDLSAVVPAMTLAHLGAAVSKNPYALGSADLTGVRRS